MLRPWHWVVRGGFVCALISMLVAPPWPVGSAQRPRGASVALRVVSATPDPALAVPLRTAVEEALAAIDTVDVASDGRPGFLLDATVTRLSTSTLSVGRRIDCEVSIVVSDARRHAVRGVLTGRSHVVGDEGTSLEHVALRAAARGALRSLPTALGTP